MPAGKIRIVRYELAGLRQVVSKLFHNQQPSLSPVRVNLCRLRISAARLLYPGDLNRSTQHLLILLDKEVADGDVTDIVHGEAEG